MRLPHNEFDRVWKHSLIVSYRNSRQILIVSIWSQPPFLTGLLHWNWRCFDYENSMKWRTNDQTVLQTLDSSWNHSYLKGKGDGEQKCNLFFDLISWRYELELLHIWQKHEESTNCIYYLLFSYQTGYIMWHSRLMIYIPFGAQLSDRVYNVTFPACDIYSLRRSAIRQGI
jgi:hypothetical protein